MQPSHFDQLARLLTVADICSPVLGTFDGTASLADAYEQWTELSMEMGLNDANEIALVEVDGRVQGWIGMHSFDAEAIASGRSLSEVTEPITPSSILAADTPILEALQVFESSEPWFYFVIRSNRLVGWLTYLDFFKLPFRLCLFALLITLEEMALQIAQRAPAHAMALLGDGHRNTARRIYRNRGYRMDEDGQEQPVLLLECASFSGKLGILRDWPELRARVPALTDGAMLTLCIDLRNAVAHAANEDRFSDLVRRETLIPFVRWAEAFAAQMQSLLAGGGLHG